MKMKNVGEIQAIKCMKLFGKEKRNQMKRPKINKDSKKIKIKNTSIKSQHDKEYLKAIDLIQKLKFCHLLHSSFLRVVEWVTLLRFLFGV